MDRVEQGWIGIDGGKDNHHAVLIDRDGQRLLSRRVINDEPDLVALIDTVQERVVDPVWAIDLATGSASLLIALLLQRDQRVVYLPGMAVNRASAGYRGEGKTDAKERTPPSSPIKPGCGAIYASYMCWRRTSPSFRLLSSYRADPAADRIRRINLVRGLLTGIFPALKRVLDFTNRGR